MADDRANQDDEYERTVGGRIAAALAAAGISQGELARRVNAAGITTRPETISRYVTNRYEPSVFVLAAIADVLDASVDELLGRAPRVATESRVERDDDIVHDPVWQAFLATDRGAKTTEAERAALSGVTRRMGRAMSVEVYEGLLSTLRTGFTPEQAESLEREHQERREAAVAKGRTLVDRKALQERARKSRSSR